MPEDRISDKIYDLARNGHSVSSELLKDPSRTPGDIAKSLYGSNSLHAAKPHPAPKHRTPASPEDLERARLCGDFKDTKPSELFLRAYHDILCCLESDPLAGMVSPSLLGSTGVVPLTVIGSLHDVARHWSNIIARAEHEVLFATNFWKASGGSTLITDALIELSQRAGQRGKRVVVKLMYDRGNVKQVFNPHQTTKPSVYTGEYVKVPGPDEVPNLDLEVVNYHQPPLGTFHPKFMIVDREIACLCSNNIQDNDNLEMSSHLEGPIVDSVWDTFVISWHNALKPPAPCTDRLAASKPIHTFQQASFMSLFNPDGQFRIAQDSTVDDSLPEHLPGSPHYDPDIAGEIRRMRSSLVPQISENHMDAIARHLNSTTGQKLQATAPLINDSALHFMPMIPSPPTAPVPIAMASRRPTGNPFQQNVCLPQNEAWLSLIRNARHSIFMQTPDLNATPLLPAITEAVRRGIEVTAYLCLGYNDAGELMPGQGGTNEMFAKSLYDELRKTPSGQFSTAPAHAQTSTATTTSETEAAYDGSSAAPNGPTTDPLDALLSRLRIHFYTAYDQTTPLHNSLKQRSCHIKLLIADSSVLVQGSGNMDTQSWYQSQEVNVMIDSPVVARSWREGIERNQNTCKYGRAGTDGCWRDEHGDLPKGSFGNNPGRFAMFKGIKGMMDKAQGK